MRVYLDNCCYNRPYDDQTQIRREPFDYTQWQKKHFADVSLPEFNRQAVLYAKEHPF
jgi:hypothetical protein